MLYGNWGLLQLIKKQGKDIPKFSTHTSSLLKTQMRRPFAIGSFPTPVASFFSPPVKNGASVQKQQQFQNMNSNQREIARKKYPDRDGDRVPDPYDCEPDNVMRQHKKNRMFREQVENKLNFGGWFRFKPKITREEGQEQVDKLNSEFKSDTKRDFPESRAYPLVRKNSYKLIDKRDIINAVAKNPQILPLMKEVHFDNLSADETLNYGVEGRYHASSNWNINPGTNKIEMPLATSRKTDIGFVLKHELAHHLQNKDDDLAALSRANEVIRKQSYATRHKDLPGEQDADRKVKEDKRISIPDNTPKPWRIKTLFPVNQKITFNSPMSDVDWSEPKRNKEYEEYAKNRPEETDDITMDYWDVPKAQQQSQYIKWMKPLDYIKQAGLDPVNNPNQARQLEDFYDKDKKKTLPIDKLGDYIESPDQPVTIPYLENSDVYGGKGPGGEVITYKSHEGRHRAWAAHLKGEKLIPVAVPPPDSWTTPEISDDFVEAAIPGSGEDYKQLWRERFKEDNYQFRFNKKQNKIYQDILEKHNVPKNNVDRPFKSVYDASEMTAAQRFGGANLKKFPKIGAGRDRNVYEIPGQGVVVKVAKNPGGLSQNDTERWGDLKVYEEGKDYVIVEKANKPGKAVSKLTKKLRPFSQVDAEKHTSEYQAMLQDIGRDDWLSMDVGFNDLRRRSSWGQKYGEPVLVDSGGLSKSSFDDHRVSDLQKAQTDTRKSEWAKSQLEDWDKIKADRRKYSSKGFKEERPQGAPSVNINMDKFFDNVITVKEPNFTNMTEQEQVDAVAQGKKPIAQVNNPGEVKTDLPYITYTFQQTYSDKAPDLPHEERIYYKNEEGLNRAKKLKKLFEQSNDGHKYTKEYHTEVGKLLGYTPEQINKFVNSPGQRIDIPKQTIELYHGTSKVGSVSVTHEGLKTSAEVAKDLPSFMKDHQPEMSDQTDPNYTYYFKDKKDAKTWAKVVSQRTGFKPAVLKVKVPKEEAERDLNMPFGEAYKKKGGVKKEDIEEVTMDYVDEGVAKRNKGKVHLDEYGKREHASQLGLNPDKTIVHGTSMDKAQQIAHSGVINNGTVVPPGRGGFEDVSVWADNVYGDKGVVVVGQATRDTDIPKNRWMTVGKRAKEREGIDVTRESIPLTKVKILKRSVEDTNELVEIPHDDGVYYPKGSNLTQEQMEDLDQNIRKTHTTEELAKFDYVYRGKGKWHGKETDDYQFDVYPKGMRWEGKKKELSTSNVPLIPWNELKGKEGIVYRGMHEDEYNEALKQGYFKSKGTHNIGQNEGDYTFGTKNIQQASSYADSFAPKVKKPQPGSTGVIVGFKNDNNKWEEGSMENQKEKFIPIGEMATSQEIPVSDVQEVYKFVPTKTKKGEYWAHKGFNDYERSIDWIPETEGGWIREDENQVYEDAVPDVPNVKSTISNVPDVKLEDDNDEDTNNEE